MRKLRTRRVAGPDPPPGPAAPGRRDRLADRLTGVGHRTLAGSFGRCIRSVESDEYGRAVTVSEPSERDRGAPATARIAPENKRANVGDLTVAVSSLVLMIGIFLPWFEFGDPATGYYSF